MAVLYAERIPLYFLPSPTIFLDVKEPKRTNDSYQLGKKMCLSQLFFMYNLLPMLTFPDLESDYLKIIAGHGVDKVIWCLL